MAKHRGFKSVDDYHDALVKNWNSVVHKKDLTYILGDVTMENPEFYPFLDKLNGRKIVVLGNHDLAKHVRQLLEHVESVAGMVHYKGFWLTHSPVHPQELSFVKGNIHAHVHEEVVRNSIVEVDYWDKKGIIVSSQGQGYYNVDAEAVNYKPKTLEELGLGIDYTPTHFLKTTS